MGRDRRGTNGSCPKRCEPPNGAIEGKAPYALCRAWTHIIAMECRLCQYILSGRWLIMTSGRIMFHDDGSMAEH